MKKILILISLCVLLGAGCARDAKNITTNTPKFPDETYDDVVINQNFCANQQQDAEEKITAFKMADADKPFFETWKKLFIKLNKMSEQDFDSHIFIFKIDKSVSNSNNSNDYTQFVFHFYYKAGDIYLARSSSRELADNFIKVKNNDLNYFLAIPDEYVTLYLAERCLKNYDDWCRFGWGGQRLKLPQLAGVPTCAEATNLLRTCQSDMLPQGISYAPDWNDQDFLQMTGASKGESFCKYATLNLITRNMVSCGDCPSDMMSL